MDDIESLKTRHWEQVRKPFHEWRVPVFIHTMAFCSSEDNTARIEATERLRDIFATEGRERIERAIGSAMPLVAAQQKILAPDLSVADAILQEKRISEPLIQTAADAIDASDALANLIALKAGVLGKPQADVADMTFPLGVRFSEQPIPAEETFRLTSEAAHKIGLGVEMDDLLANRTQVNGKPGARFNRETGRGEMSVGKVGTLTDPRLAAHEGLHAL
ncbi:MAG: hypothetical protein EB060_09290, partial [Proteobacteria bacterium]|nr:hypothetical protein [Pseudomonadota bacterium]